ncbi:carbohydrate sulfotransferase 4-like [Ptychodera flava]|uniref:carbohydrate sulfotransferase 4-like n=1 Tax=Ptychodera flava TaxID=63121 RepID=UPI00396A58E8
MGNTGNFMWRGRYRRSVIVIAAVLCLLLWIESDAIQNFLTKQKYGGGIVSGVGDDVTDTKLSKRRLRVLVHARMRTGSTLTARYIASNPDFFYVYEPGHMIIEYNDMDLSQDGFDYLERIRHELVDFMHSFLHCNFTGRDYFFKSINKNGFQRYFSNITHLDLPVREADVTAICRSKPHIITKVNRLNNILFASAVLKEDDVKVIHLVRDPRGFANSRRSFRGFKDSKGGEHFTFPEKLEQDIRNYCTWLDTNYLPVKNSDSWFKENVMLIRYEDLADWPEEIVPKMYTFVRLQRNTQIQRLIKLSMKGKGQAWRLQVNIDEVKRIQDLCPDEVFRTFGYVKVHDEGQLRNTSISLVKPVTDVVNI